MNGMKIVSLLISMIFVFGCTKNQSPMTADNSPGVSQGRSPASVGKRKKVKIIRKGFYIDSKSLRYLSYDDRAAYYRIFAKASVDFERLIGKSRKYSFMDDPIKSFIRAFIALPYSL